MKHLINDKEISDGQTGTYADATGKKHSAVIKQIHPTYHADIEAQVDGSSKFFENVPFNANGGAHSWGHPQEEDGAQTPAHTGSAKSKSKKSPGLQADYDASQGTYGTAQNSEESTDTQNDTQSGEFGQ